MKYSLTQFEEFENKPFIVIPPVIVNKIKDIYKVLFPNNLFPTKKLIKQEPTKINFVPIIKDKNKIESNINKIKTLLNKLTEKSYDEILIQIDQIVSEITEDKDSIGNLIFDIACTNRYYSLLYTNICGFLIEKYEFMKEIFNISYKNYIKMFEKIEYVDPSINYDKFCENNKLNEKRKTMSLFIVNLVKKNILNREDIKELYKSFIINVIDWKQDNNKKNEITEITENIFILNNLFSTELNILSIKNKTIYEWFKEFSTYDLKEYPGITSKTKFKYMDILNI